MDFQMKDGRLVTVREFQQDDFEGLLGMFDSLSAKALRFGLPPYDRPRLERWISGLGGGVLFLALEGSRVVAVAMIFGRTLTRLKGIGEFVIYVHQDYQGQGLGTFLTKRILQEARSRGFHRIGLNVVANNTAAVQVYRQAGFVEEGRLKDAFFGDDGKYHDELIMGVIL